MPNILVVDDSEVDRRLVAGLLSHDLDWLVEFAADGSEALDKIELALPDVVITDMKMPRMDGMELVHNVHTHFPDVPVILITGHGSEELAVEALREGATSYVPKDKLAGKLRETVEQVLDLSRADRSYARLISCLDGVEYSFALDSDPMLVPPLVDLIQQMLAAVHCCDATTRMHAGIALEEALLNAVLSGNLELSVPDAQEARERVRRGAESELVEQRRGEAPFRDRATHVTARISPDSARFVVRDDGRGFDTSTVPAASDPATLRSGRGRGLVLMKNFMDEVEFNSRGNEVTMVKRCEGAGSPLAPAAPLQE